MDILVVEGEAAIGKLVVRLLARSGWKVDWVRSPSLALTVLSEVRPKLVVSEWDFIREDASALYRACLQAQPPLPVLFILANSRPSIPGHAHLPKPFCADALCDAVSALMVGESPMNAD